jgi:hypothetical protein
MTPSEYYLTFSPAPLPYPLWLSEQAQPSAQPSHREIANAIEQMITYIKVNGWGQKFVRAGNRVCMQGAFNYRRGADVPISSLENFTPLGFAVANVLASFVHGSIPRYYPPWDRVITFNDSPRTQLDDVMTVLYRALQAETDAAVAEEQAAAVTVPDTIPAEMSLELAAAV